MKSPFPGMDPYLEGHKWPDFHATYSLGCKRSLVKQLSDQYIVEVEARVYIENIEQEPEKRLNPDVSVVHLDDSPLLDKINQSVNLTPVTTVEPLRVPVSHRQYNLVIRHAEGDTVSAIEILSPVNKRMPNLEKYREKRSEYQEKGVHLLELDFLRGGERPFKSKNWSDYSYSIQLLNAHDRKLYLWAIQLWDKLPTVAIPLIRETETVELDLQAVFEDTYESSAYHRSLKYDTQVPGPKLGEIEKEYINSLSLN
ncbi:MAG: DUF4058 family protein [Bacteroidota bacterium]